MVGQRVCENSAVQCGIAGSVHDATREKRKDPPPLPPLLSPCRFVWSLYSFASLGRSRSGLPWLKVLPTPCSKGLAAIPR